jgi:DNA-binding CsgD family transcriptional regulator
LPNWLALYGGGDEHGWYERCADNLRGVDVTVLLDNRMQSAVHRLLMAEPEAGAMLPSSAVESLARLIGCDGFGIDQTDRTGYRLRQQTFPHVEPVDPRVCDGPVPTGFQHDAAKPPDERDAADAGLRDLVRLGFSTGSGTVIQLYFARRLRYFSAHDIAVLAMVEPAIRRLVRSCGEKPPAESLSISERKVLTLVATGASNRQVAEELFVTVHTVRKHLEHAYRKLGVTNRTAAALTVRNAS